MMTKHFGVGAVFCAVALIAGCSAEVTDQVGAEGAVKLETKANDYSIIKPNSEGLTVLRTYKPADGFLLTETVSPYDDKRACIFLGKGADVLCFNNVSIVSAQPKLLAAYKVNNTPVIEFTPGFTPTLRCVATASNGIHHQGQLHCN
ncbi:hypothetical protein [Micavibrio aeruginosavorus]|nr:hypothetical protein [Micavibrio aeruginosavorus]